MVGVVGEQFTVESDGARARCFIFNMKKEDLGFWCCFMLRCRLQVCARRYHQRGGTGCVVVEGRNERSNRKK
jgi:hypothetical protein